jgi:hypothetical protein
MLIECTILPSNMVLSLSFPPSLLDYSSCRLTLTTDALSLSAAVTHLRPLRPRSRRRQPLVCASHGGRLRVFLLFSSLTHRRAGRLRPPLLKPRTPPAPIRPASFPMRLVHLNLPRRRRPLLRPLQPLPQPTPPAQI